ncbi:MAG: hypothetical protein GY696_27390 [Gammaproteobacteria bacterium]|nr:hypothetical protein [Gammaproteobacteria bacterium]
MTALLECTNERTFEHGFNHINSTALQWQNNLTYNVPWGSAPRPRGGNFVARMKLGAPPPDPRQLHRKNEAGETPAGAAPRTPASSPRRLRPRPRRLRPKGSAPRPPLGLRPRPR